MSSAAVVANNPSTIITSSEEEENVVIININSTHHCDELECKECSTSSTSSDSAITSEDDSEEPKPAKTCSYQSITTHQDHHQFLQQFTALLLEEAIYNGTSRSQPVLNFMQPESLLATLTDLKPQTLPATHDDLLQMARDTIKYSVKTGHPYFVNQLFSGVDPYGLAGQWLTDALNPSVYTYEVAPVFTLMEEVVLKEMRSILGWRDGLGDGIFCPGGSLANGYAISCARHHFNEHIKTSGLAAHQTQLTLFTSEDAHYSITKLASFMGLGSSNVIKVKTDSRGKMDTAHLRVRIDEVRAGGGAPFMISATAGTTVLGAFDPLHELAAICKEEGMWLHVDAAWGGGVLLSEKHRGLVKGIEKADSVTWNPHKLLAAPQQCSTLLLPSRHSTVLSHAHATGAAYLFQPDKCYDAATYDTGDKHIQCGRRADVLKFWFMWKAKGTLGLRQHIETVFERSQQFTEAIRERDGFRLVLDNPECTNVCFWYIPERLRQLEGTIDTNEWEKQLHLVAPKMKQRMMQQGTMMVTYQAQGKWPNFFRIVFQSSALTEDDVKYLVEEFQRLGQDL